MPTIGIPAIAHDDARQVGELALAELVHVKVTAYCTVRQGVAALEQSLLAS